MPIYAFRYEHVTPDTKAVRARESFIKHASNEDEARQLARPHFRYLQQRTSDKLVLKEVVEYD